MAAKSHDHTPITIQYSLGGKRGVRKVISDSEWCALSYGAGVLCVSQTNVHLRPYSPEVGVKGQEVEREGTSCRPLRGCAGDMESKALGVCVRVCV